MDALEAALAEVDLPAAGLADAPGEGLATPLVAETTMICTEAAGVESGRYLNSSSWNNAIIFIQ